MRPGASQPLHGTAVARFTPAGWRGVLITGPSGAGKSDLALRLTGRGWRLVADDYVHVFASGGRLHAAAPDALAGRMEARGVGIVPACASGVVPLALEIALTGEAVERLPDPDARTLDGVVLPRLRLNPFEASAVEKVAAALSAL